MEANQGRESCDVGLKLEVLVSPRFSVYCQTSVLPSRTILTSDLYFQGMGVGGDICFNLTLSCRYTSVTKTVSQATKERMGQ